MDKTFVWEKGMKEHYQKMFAYNAWANRLFVECLKQPGIVNAKSFLLMSHVLTAEEVWYCRLAGLNAPLEKLWKEYAVQELEQKMEERNQAWETYLKDNGGDRLAASIHYRKAKGETYTTAVSDVLNHVINHGTYHRAQIASLLRLESVDPPVSDYIMYIRQQAEFNNDEPRPSPLNP